MQIFVRHCEATDISSLDRLVSDGRHSVEADYFETAYQEQTDSKRIVFLLFKDHKLCGYAHLNFYPQYASFQRFKIPEIQDIFIHPDERRQGFGQTLMVACEVEAKKRSYITIGIGVGVSSNFGTAQRLYHRMGYIPDGNGVVFDRIPVTSGDIRPIDDRLCMMLVKDI